MREALPKIAVRLRLQEITIEIAFELGEQTTDAVEVAMTHQGKQRFDPMFTPIGIANDAAMFQIGDEHDLGHEQLGIEFAKPMRLQVFHDDLEIPEQHVVDAGFCGKPVGPFDKYLARLHIGA